MRVMSFNIKGGGVRDGSDEPWRAAIEIVRSEDPDALLLQECKGWDKKGFKRYFDTEEALGMRGLMALAPLVECHTAVFIKPSLRPRGFQTQYSPLAWHAFSPAELAVDGLREPLTLISVHLSPWPPEHRLIEAGLLPRFAARGRFSIAGGDFNCVPPGDPEPDWEHVTPEQRVYHALPDVEPLTADRRVGNRLMRAGFVDPARLLADRTGQRSLLAPTGTGERGRHRYRSDQFWVSPSVASAIVGYRVVDTPAARAASDHLPIVLDIDLGKITT